MLTVGEILKKEREKKGYSLSHIEKKIRVREKFLAAIEENNWGIFSSKIYVSGVIKNYALFLGVDPEKVLAFFRRDYARREEVTFRKKVASRHLIPQTKLYATVGLGLLILGFVSYFAYQVNMFISPPKVKMLQPQTNTFKKVKQVEVIGKTEKEAVITIFNDQIFQNNDGIFIYEYTLKPGKNSLSIEVTGANGKKTIVKKEFYLVP